jgi:monoterpene epsilon-lactone hydrolase
VHTEASRPTPRSSFTTGIIRWLSLRAYGLVMRSLFRARTPPQTMRRRFERFGRTSRATVLARHPTVVFGDHRVGELAIESVRATAHPATVLLYLHGGAFVMGSPSSYRSRAVRLSYRCNAEVLVPDYRLAPEHPFPAALEDALAAWRAAGPIASGRPLLVGGDSAGGGLALSLMILLRELGEASPRGAVLLSPSANQTRGAVSGRHRDLWLDADRLRQWRRHYLGTADPRDPRVSPALADLSGLPPMLVLVGEDEALAEETYRWVARARGAGTDARLLVGAGMQHDWPLTLPWLAESRRAWREISEFVKCSANPPHRRTRAALEWSST